MPTKEWAVRPLDSGQAAAKRKAKRLKTPSKRRKKLKRGAN